jgi:hypothetical protein
VRSWFRVTREVHDAVSTSGTARTARLNEPSPVLVEEGVDGSPRLVNRQAVSVVREEWRVVDRWWTEEPVSRRYFDLVLEGGERFVVYRDVERGSWFQHGGNRRFPP